MYYTEIKSSCKVSSNKTLVGVLNKMTQEPTNGEQKFPVLNNHSN